jgi:hypothetical protein
MKNGLIRGLLLVACFTTALLLAGCAAPAKAHADGKTYYTKYNVHYYVPGNQAQKYASIVNWTDLAGHGILPYNSQVTIGSYKKGFALVDAKTNESINVECIAKYATMSGAEYTKLLLSETPVSYSNLSETDRKGIAEGKALSGMSKTGVMVALGYPVPFATPSTDANTWNYWRNRFEQIAVDFQNGSVVSVTAVAKPVK